MYKIKLPQPYASLVIAGAVTTLPVECAKEFRVGEKVYIYATDFQKSFQRKFDYTNPLYLKIYNEMFFGNVPSKWDEYPTEQFLGSVQITDTGEVYDYYLDLDNLCDELFITNAHRFNEIISDFDATISTLESSEQTLTKPKRMSRDRAMLKVPVSKWVWDILQQKDIERIQSVFWEDYMSDLAPDEINDDDDIYEGLNVRDDVSWEQFCEQERMKQNLQIDVVRFRYGNQTIDYCTLIGSKKEDRILKNTNACLKFLIFDLDEVADGDKINFNYNRVRNSTSTVKRNTIFMKRDGLIRYGNIQRPRWNSTPPCPIAGSIPFGGENKWRRKSKRR